MDYINKVKTVIIDFFNSASIYQEILTFLNSIANVWKWNFKEVVFTNKLILNVCPEGKQQPVFLKVTLILKAC